MQTIETHRQKIAQTKRRVKALNKWKCISQGKLTVSRGTSCVDDTEQVMCIKRSVFNNGAAHLPKVVSWEFFYS